jgi:hypothetical protein
LPTPDYKKHTRALAWGLNLDQPDVTTPEEIAEFRRISAAQLGVQQAGLDFWLDTSPDVLKRYRLRADKLRIMQDDESPNKWSASGVVIMYVYALTGFEENTLRQLPKQTEPYALLRISITRGFAGGIREGLLLARASG